MKKEELLNAAADLIEKRGLCKGAYESSQGSLCVIGAIRTASNGSVFGAFPEVVYDAIHWFAAVSGVEWIPKWNDAPERTKDEVVAALRQAAKGTHGS